MLLWLHGPEESINGPTHFHSGPTEVEGFNSTGKPGSHQ